MLQGNNYEKIVETVWELTTLLNLQFRNVAPTINVINFKKKFLPHILHHYLRDQDECYDKHDDDTCQESPETAAFLAKRRVLACSELGGSQCFENTLLCTKKTHSPFILFAKRFFDGYWDCIKNKIYWHITKQNDIDFRSDTLVHFMMKFHRVQAYQGAGLCVPRHPPSTGGHIGGENWCLRLNRG